MGEKLFCLVEKKNCSFKALAVIMCSTYYVSEVKYCFVLVFILLKMVCTDCQTTSYIVYLKPYLHRYEHTI